MTRVIWNNVGERTYEIGIDRGMLYVDDTGVPWNGLVSVAESPSGAEVQPYYVDGIKYLNLLSDEEFEATIEAYTYPDEFEECDGTKAITNGLFITQQPKKMFSFSYRTKIGNDVDAEDHGYKIHLVYDALAAPTERPNNTISESMEPFNFSWKITTKPPSFTGYKESSHFVIDSRETPEDLMTQIENILYGSYFESPRLPSIPELIYIFGIYETMVFDAGSILEPFYATIDGGPPMPDPSSTIDGGGP